MTTAVILAGGLGTRLKSVVSDVPKPMAPINGRPFLEHQLDYWIAQGISHAVLSIGYKSDIISAHFGTRYRGIAIDYAVEHEPLGTGGGLLLALDKLPDHAPFLVLNGDSFVEASLPSLTEVHAKHHSDWTLVVFKADTPDRYTEVKTDREGRVLEHQHRAKTGDFASAGVYLISPGILTSLGWKAGERVSLEQDLLPTALKADKRCFTAACAGVFIDIGVPEDYVRAAQLRVFNT